MIELINSLTEELNQKGLTFTLLNKILILLEQIDIKSLEEQEQIKLYSLLEQIILNDFLSEEIKEDIMEFISYIYPTNSFIKWNRELDIFDDKNSIYINNKEVTIDELEQKGIEYIDLPITRPNKEIIIEEFNIRIHHDGQIEKIEKYKVQKEKKNKQLYNDFMQIILNKELML